MVNFLIVRPVAILMASLALIVLSALASVYVPISLLPSIDVPKIIVDVNAQNLTARQLENIVVKPLRNSLLQLNHLEDLKSETSDEQSIIRLNFRHGTKMNYSFIEVNEKIDRAMTSLPRDLLRPKVIKANSSEIPAFYLNVTLKKTRGANYDADSYKESADFNRFVNQVIKRRIEQLSEVALVDISGLSQSEILVVPKTEKLLSLGIGIEELDAFIKEKNIEIGNILVNDGQYQYSLRLGGFVKNVKDLKETYINVNNRLYPFQDLATIRTQPRKQLGLVISNGKDAVTLAIIKQSNARMGNLKQALKSAMVQMEREYPEIAFTISRDQTKLLDYTMNNLANSLLRGLLLAFVVVFLFLKDLKSPILICITVPISLLLCLLFFYTFSISINIVSLSGLILGTGLIIDNSIIVIDNIGQYREKGYSLLLACVNGTNEVFRPLLSSALTTCAVFVPLIFLSGMAGELFYDQALAISIGLLVSLLVSVTLLPVLYNLLYSRNTRKFELSFQLQKKGYFDYNTLYQKGFRFIMKRQKLVLMLYVFLSLIALVLFVFLPKEQIPKLSSTETILHINWNEPINVDENKQRITDLILSRKDSIIDYMALVGQQQFLLERSTNIRISETELYLKTKNQNTLRSIEQSLENEIQRRYPKSSFEYKEVENVFNVVFSSTKSPLTARLQNLTSGRNERNRLLKSIWDSVQKHFPYKALQPILWQDQITLLADAEKLMVYQISSKDLTQTIKSAFGGMPIFTIIDNNESIPVVWGNRGEDMNRILAMTFVKAKDNTAYPLSLFLRKTNTKDLQTITAGKEGEYYPINLIIGQKEKASAISTIRSIVNKEGKYNVMFSGSLFEASKLFRELILVLLVTLCLLYFILAAQFESLILPLVILIEIPVSTSGALIFLSFFGMGFNLMSLIGIVVMIGIVINDSILKIDAGLQLRRKGHSKLKALLIAGEKRVKPILMTSLTTILVLLPILFAEGMGNELQAPLAVALMGGMIVGTLASLYLIPILVYNITK